MASRSTGPYLTAHDVERLRVEARKAPRPGLYAKYSVRRTRVGKKSTPVGGAFVLLPGTDPIARIALGVYAEEARQRGKVELAADIWRWLESLGKKKD